ncbi:transmembrane gamma-carboxyglutamic acid protein 3 isoform 3-T8 [Molossus nigricans]
MAVFLEAKNAHSVLKRFPRANEFLEELRQGTIERECMEEICSYEEVKEVFEDKEKTMEFWKGYPNAVYSVRDPAQSSDAMYVVVPLLGVALLIVIALFIIWRLSSATPPPSYEEVTAPQESSSDEEYALVLCLMCVPSRSRPRWRAGQQSFWCRVLFSLTSNEVPFQDCTDSEISTSSPLKSPHTN